MAECRIVHLDKPTEGMGSICRLNYKIAVITYQIDAVKNLNFTNLQTNQNQL